MTYTNRDQKRSVMQVGSTVKSYEDGSGKIIKVSHKTTLFSDGTFQYQIRVDGKFHYVAVMDWYVSLETAMSIFESHYLGYQFSDYVQTVFQGRERLDSILSNCTEVSS